MKELIQDLPWDFIQFLHTLSWIPVAAHIEAFFDARKGVINHTISAWVRVIIAVLYGMLMVTGWQYQITYAAICLIVYWIFFDPSYNLWDRRRLWQMGSTATLDKLARKVVGEDGGLYMILKVLLFAGITTLYFHV